jgi:hypothetical protein
MEEPEGEYIQILNSFPLGLLRCYCKWLVKNKNLESRATNSYLPAPSFVLLITLSLVNSSLSFSSKALDIFLVNTWNRGIVIFFRALARF